MEPFGFLVIDKPQGMTSHDVVAAVRRGIKIKRIGHAGTLDPLATGVLVLCIGQATRLSEYVMNSTKVYVATVCLGVATDTYDAEGKTLHTAAIQHLTPDDIINALKHFQGEVDQIPPMYSAIKIGGKKLYELARQDQEVERAPRRVTLQTELIELALPDVRIKVTCSAGTYIRSIAHDLGAMLGVGGHLTALRRTDSGTLSTGVDWRIFQTAMDNGTWQQYLISEDVALARIPALNLDQQATDDVLHGRMISGITNENPLRRAYGLDGQFIAILEGTDNRWKPVKVFHV
jgi:tRNA pseudouridine55 synthase